MSMQAIGEKVIIKPEDRPKEIGGIVVAAVKPRTQYGEIVSFDDTVNPRLKIGDKVIAMSWVDLEHDDVKYLVAYPRDIIILGRTFEKKEPNY